jgi:hypothetical protein
MSCARGTGGVHPSIPMHCAVKFAAATPRPRLGVDTPTEQLDRASTRTEEPGPSPRLTVLA